MDEELQLLDTHLTGFSSDLPRPTRIKESNFIGVQIPPGQTKYGQLLAVVEGMSKDLRPAYSGSRSSAERLKRGIVHARILVRECLIETEKSARQ